MPLIALAGNPNTGKSTLFNALTGEKNATGNWPGVTVEKREGKTDINGKEVTVTDLPGAYSLTPLTTEESVTADFLKNERADIVINVLNPSFLRRELFLTCELLSLKMPIIIAVNMADEMEEKGITLDTEALSAVFGVPVVKVSAKGRMGLDEIKSRIGACIETSSSVQRENRIQKGAEHPFIRAALEKSGYSVPENASFRMMKKLDKLLVGKYTAFPFLALVMVFMFSLAFGMPGQLFTHAVDRFFTLLVSAFSFVFAYFPAWADSLLKNGVLTGMFSVLSFLPQVAVLYFFTAFIEESGYMARAAFITDKLLRKIGLSGRSIIPMIMGLGCTTTAVTAARTADSERDRRMTVMLTPFVSCGAKMPVYALIASECFGKAAPAAIMGVYLTGFLTLSVSGALINRIMNRKTPSAFLLELPPYRMPEAGVILKRSFSRIGEFARRAGSVIVITSAVSWFLTYYTPSLQPAVSAENSMLAHCAKSVSAVFRPLGFGSWQTVSALLSGIFAKEGILSSLRIFSGGSVKALFTGQNPFSYLVFILLSPPCASALVSIKKELGSAKLFLFSTALQLSWAAAAAFLINLIS